MANEQWDDVVIWDTSAILACAKELVHDAFRARQAGDHLRSANYMTKALDTFNDIEHDYPEAVSALRGSLERL